MRSQIQGVVLTFLLLTSLAFGQNQLKFTSVNATVEGAIQLHWASNTNDYYEIDYADSIIDTDVCDPVEKSCSGP